MKSQLALRNNDSLAYVATPNENRRGDPLNVWESLMGHAGAEPPYCVTCSALKCDNCPADVLTAHEKKMAANPEVVNVI